jgi:hypothetical protein
MDRIFQQGSWLSIQVWSSRTLLGMLFVLLILLDKNFLKNTQPVLKSSGNSILQDTGSQQPILLYNSSQTNTLFLQKHLQHSTSQLGIGSELILLLDKSTLAGTVSLLLY